MELMDWYQYQLVMRQIVCTDHLLFLVVCIIDVDYVVMRRSTTPDLLQGHTHLLQLMGLPVPPPAHRCFFHTDRLAHINTITIL